ncbi:hypothetical protein [Shewanella frigidimarina]
MTFSQQLATSKTMKMLLTQMPAEESARWGIRLLPYPQQTCE